MQANGCSTVDRRSDAGDALLAVGTIELGKIAVDRAFDGCHPPREAILREVPLAMVHSLELAAVDSDGGCIEKMQIAAQRDELRADPSAVDPRPR